MRGRRKDGIPTILGVVRQVNMVKDGHETSRVPTEDPLESMGEVGVEMLDGNVASESTVGGREGGRT
jgi:hypothetical protein